MNNFDEYIRQGEPSQKEKAQIWQIAIGLQDVDGLKPSEYLLKTAKENIEGKITLKEVNYRIENYYKQIENGEKADEKRTEEADKVSARIAELLSEQTFSFTPIEYIDIHKRLFTGIYKFAGKIRDYNIAKSEWALDGDTVMYASSRRLKETLEYDFNEEKKFNYKGLTIDQIIEHLAHFVAYLWQIHIFGEGNTRTTAVFLIKYLRKLGFKNVNNELFAKHSLYFRNALVRANFEDLYKGIYKTEKFLIRFFSNLLLGENNELKNRTMHINFKETDLEIHRTTKERKAINDTVNDTVKAKNDTVFSLIQQNPKITATKLAEHLNIGIATVKRELKRLKDNRQIERIGSDKTGEWTINSSNSFLTP